MKLPPMNDQPVQSTAMLSLSAPASVLQSKQVRMAGLQESLGKAGEIGMTIYKQDGAAEHSKMAAEYTDRMNAARDEIEKEPYRMDDNGNLVSRHTEIQEELKNVQSVTRSDILTRTENNLAYRQLEKDITGAEVMYNEAMRGTVGKWAALNAQRNLDESFRVNIASGRFDLAEMDINKGAQTKAWNGTEIAKRKATVVAHKQFTVGKSTIVNMAPPKTLQDVSDLHTKFDKDKQYLRLEPAQRTALHNQLDEKIQGAIAETIQYKMIYDTDEEAWDLIQAYAARPWIDSGFSSEDNYTSAIAHAITVFNQRKEKDKATTGEIAAENCYAQINGGGWGDHKNTCHKKAADRIIAERTGPTEANPEGMKEGSNEWIRENGKLARQIGWVPPSTESWIRGNLDFISADSDDGSVLNAAKMMVYLDRHIGRTKDKFDQAMIDKAYVINETGGGAIEGFKNLREGEEAVPITVRNQRDSVFAGEYDKGSSDALKGFVKDDLTWTQFGTPDFTSQQVESYNQLRKSAYRRTGNIAAADSLAYQDFKRKYTITDRGAGRSLEYMQPESVVNDGPTPEITSEYMTEEYHIMAEELGVDPDDYKLLYKLSDSAEHEWLMIDEDGLILNGPNGFPAYFKPSYKKSKVKARTDLQSEMTEIEAKLDVEREQQAHAARYAESGTGKSLGDAMEEDLRTSAQQAVSWGVDFFEAVLGDPSTLAERQKAAQELSQAPNKARKERIRKYEASKLLPKGAGPKTKAMVKRRMDIQQQLEDLQ